MESGQAKTEERNESGELFQKSGRKPQINSAQLIELQKIFEKNNYPTKSTIEQVAERIGKGVNYVRGWFGRKRMETKVNLFLLIYFNLL
jgi:hypothetical protein